MCKLDGYSDRIDWQVRFVWSSGHSLAAHHSLAFRLKTVGFFKQNKPITDQGRLSQRLYVVILGFLTRKEFTDLSVLRVTMCSLSGLIILDELTSSHEEVCRAEPNAYDFLYVPGSRSR